MARIKKHTLSDDACVNVNPEISRLSATPGRAIYDGKRQREQSLGLKMNYQVEFLLTDNRKWPDPAHLIRIVGLGLGRPKFE